MSRIRLALALVVVGGLWVGSPASAQYQLRDPSAGNASEDEEDVEDEEDEEDVEDEEGREHASTSSAASSSSSTSGASTSSAAASSTTIDEAQAPAETAHPSDGRTTSFVPPPPPPRAAGDFQLPIPPIFLYERRGGITSTAVFPAFYLRESPETSELVIPPVYHREGTEPFDVVFPLFWWYRGAGHHTWIAGPAWHHEDAESHDVGVAPLFMSGRHRDRYYHAIPPLLTLAWGSADEDYLSAGLLGYRFRNHEDERWGIFPFVWVHSSPGEEYQLVPPLFYRWRNPELDRTLTIFAPFYHQQDRAESFWGIAGLLHHDEGPGFHSTTIPPLLFHWSESPDAFRLSTPAFLYVREGRDETLVSWVYQRFRGATELDAVLPLFAHVRDPRDRSETLMVTPLLWHWSSPAFDNWAVLPFLLSLEDHGRSHLWLTPLFGNYVNRERNDETTWIAPSLQISRWHDGDAVNLHPIWYYESVPSHRFTVLTPLWFDFEQYEQRSRYTVAFPFYYRVVEGVTESQVTLPLATYFRRRQWPHEGRWEWEIHVSGLFDYGERSEGEHWWRILYGLVGWEHRLGHDRLWLFYLPIDFRSASTAPAEPSSSVSALPSLEPPRF